MQQYFLNNVLCYYITRKGDNMDAAQLANQALISSFEEMDYLLQQVIQILTREREKGKIGFQKIMGGLVELESEGEAIVVGDLHGDLKSLTIILKQSQFLSKIDRKKIYLIFLGDYGDRGKETVEVYWVILKLKLTFPENVVLLRGNHEGPKDLGVHPFDLPYFLMSRYGRKWQDLFPLFPKLFDSFHHTLIVREKYLMLHGGIPEEANSIEDIARAHQTHPTTNYLTQILWNDPGEGGGSYPSLRGAGIIFGEDISQKVLGKLKVKTLIRSHEPCEGVLTAHKGRVLTLFSRKGHPYYNSKAAYLEIDLSAPAKDAYQLAKEAHLF